MHGLEFGEDFDILEGMPSSWVLVSGWNGGRVGIWASMGGRGVVLEVFWGINGGLEM